MNINYYDITDSKKIKEMFDMFKPELLKAFNEQYNDYYNELELIRITGWSKEEKDGENYPAKTFQLLAYKGYDKWVGTYFVVKFTPFDCYFSEGRLINCNIEDVGNLTNKELTKFYRRKMQEVHGEVWVNTFKAYINRVKKRREQNLNDAYNKMLKDIEDDINEELSF